MPEAVAPRLRLATAVLAVALGLALRAGSTSALWLDESLSVAIARLPLHDLRAALRQDGSPPLYYVLLHGWMTVFGDSDGAVRALSGVLSAATLPVVWSAARRLQGRTAARASVLLLASSPFAVRYATETRMYALVLLLAALGCLALVRAWERPEAGRLVAVASVTAALLYTHYWSLFLLAAVVVSLLVSLRGHRSRALPLLLALFAGGCAFLPWLPTLLFQSRHTGAPWAPPAGFEVVLGSLQDWSGGATGAGRLLAAVLLLLAGAGLGGQRAPDGRTLLGNRPEPAAIALAAVWLGTLLLGVGVGKLSGSAYASRYSIAALLPLVLLAARGAAVLPRALARAMLAIAVVAGLVGAASAVTTRRTNADEVAAALSAAVAGDVVVYCPDQLGPSVGRYLRTPAHQLVFPSGTSPERVDWVDYARRNAAADVPRFVGGVDAAAGSSHTVWLVYAGGYRTYGRRCEGLAQALRTRRERTVVVPSPTGVLEHPALVRYAPLPPR